MFKLCVLLLVIAAAVYAHPAEEVPQADLGNTKEAILPNPAEDTDELAESAGQEESLKGAESAWGWGYPSYNRGYGGWGGRGYGWGGRGYGWGGWGGYRGGWGSGRYYKYW